MIAASRVADKKVRGKKCMMEGGMIEKIGKEVLQVSNLAATVWDRRIADRRNRYLP